MRTIRRSTAFRRDFKRLLKDSRHHDLDAMMNELVSRLAADAPLPERLQDHKLAGPWTGYRDCHVKPDLVLIYRRIGDDLLQLARLGTHSDLFRK
jgi:mRNA interferase YafQ